MATMSFYYTAHGPIVNSTATITQPKLAQGILDSVSSSASTCSLEFQLPTLSLLQSALLRCPHPHTASSYVSQCNPEVTFERLYITHNRFFPKIKPHPPPGPHFQSHAYFRISFLRWLSRLNLVGLGHTTMVIFGFFI
jgi:hypothetical protein